MSYSKYYNPTNWENYPSEDTAINAMHLNNLEDGVDTLDDRIVALSTDKSEVSWNQTLISGEKIAEITVNGITKDVYAPEISDSVVEQAAEQALKSEGYAVGTQGDIPVTSGLYYHNNSKYYSEQASDSASDASTSAVEAGQSADDAEEEALVSEGWAVGEQNGVPVPSTSPYYHNNSKYWSEQSNPTRFSSLSDVNFGTLEDGDIPVYDVTSEKWVNETGVSTDLKSNTTGQFNTRTGGILNSCVVNIEPKQSGSGTPSPSNVRPITGHSSVKVGNVGKNRLPLTLANLKTVNTAGTWSGNKYSIFNVEYEVHTDSDGNVTDIKVNGTASAEHSFYFANPLSFLSENVSYIFSIGNTTGSTSTYCINIPNADSKADNITFTYASNMTQARFLVRANKTVNNQIIKPMIRLATDTDATFEPYNGTDYTISLGQTVYGGKFDAVSGVLTVTHAHVDLGSYTWYKTNANLFYTEYPRDFKKAVYASGYWYANGVCECYKFIQNSITSEDGVINLYFEEARSFYRMFVNDSSRYSLSASDFKTAVTGQYLVYPLATPLTIQLTPTQINTLIGENHLDIPLEGQTLDSLSYREMMAWDDVNDVVNLRVPISAIGTDESNNDVSSQAYSQGDYFYKNGIAKAKTSIAQGATFTLNTNYEIKTLAEILQAIESAL